MTSWAELAAGRGHRHGGRTVRRREPGSHRPIRSRQRPLVGRDRPGEPERLDEKDGSVSTRLVRTSRTRENGQFMGLSIEGGTAGR